MLRYYDVLEVCPLVLQHLWSLLPFGAVHQVFVNVGVVGGHLGLVLGEIAIICSHNSSAGLPDFKGMPTKEHPRLREFRFPSTAERVC